MMRQTSLLVHAASCLKISDDGQFGVRINQSVKAVAPSIGFVDTAILASGAFWHR